MMNTKLFITGKQSVRISSMRSLKDKVKVLYGQELLKRRSNTTGWLILIIAVESGQ